MQMTEKYSRAVCQMCQQYSQTAMHCNDPQIIPKKIERDESCSGLIGLSKNISELIRNLIELQGNTQQISLLDLKKRLK